MEALRRLLRQVSEGVSAAVQLGLFTRMARAPGWVAAGEGCAQAEWDRLVLRAARRAANQASR